MTTQLFSCPTREYTNLLKFVNVYIEISVFPRTPFGKCCTEPGGTLESEDLIPTGMVIPENSMTWQNITL